MMRLELVRFPVRHVEWGPQTEYHRGTLRINKEELVNLLLEDKRVAKADLDIASPGERTRIINVRDVVEPRVKISGPGCVFPGILGPVVTVGMGRTCTLPGMTVIASAEYRATILSGTAAKSSGIVDMWGPVASLCPFGSTINVVAMTELIDGVTELEAHAAIQSAEFRVARRLAEATRGLPPEEIECFELYDTNPDLPRVVYILTCLTEVHHPHSGVAYYGLPIRESLPTLMHPNELLDGALTVNARGGGGINTTTWTWMNQPVTFELLRRHGKELNFLGIILQRTRFETEFGKQVTAECASQIAKLLRADGAMITRTVTSGNNFMDVMFTVQACERKGIKMVFITPEWGGKDGTELPLAFYVPEALAMVSTGSFERDLVVPAPEKVIGAGNKQSVTLYAGDKPFNPWEEITLPSSFCVTGGVDWFGFMRQTCTPY